MAKFKAKTKDCLLIVKVKLPLGEKINEREFDFFSRKSIRGFFKARMVRKSVVAYSGPIGISLYDRMKKPIGRYDFFFIIEQIVDVVQKAKINGLNVNKIIWDLKNVFINETTREMQFIYLPTEQQAEADLTGFMESIIYSAIPAKEQDQDSISRFVYFLKGLKGFREEKIEQYIAGEDRTIVNTIKKHNVGQSGFMTDKPADYYKHYGDDEATELLDEAATGLLEDDEATGLLSGEEATGLLEDNEEATGLLKEENTHYASLYRMLTGELIWIDKPVFRLGKERSYSDYLICDNDKVSRSHADIVTRGTRFFIRDLNSKNKTYINGQPIPAQQEIEIFGGDQIRLANEEFELRI